MDLLTPRAVRKMLSVSRETLLKLEKEGKLPSFRLRFTDHSSGQRRYKKEDVEIYVKSMRA